jgi:UDP-3-O-[3-hydroxymyristoyl] glucosamine N-acyltransferase
MRFPNPVPIGEIARLIHARIKGDPSAQATGINEIHRVEQGDLAFVDHPKYYDKCLGSAASFLIINADVDCPPGKALLIVDDPFDAYLTIVRRFRPYEPSISRISATATLGEGTIVEQGAVLGNHVRVGRDCTIHQGVVVRDHCVIGDRVVIQAGTVIGSEPFYYNTRKDREVWYRRMESCGRVVVEDDVEIGANCTIDRGVTHDTRIGRGTKMDNLVHVGHDTVIGRNCLIAAQVGIAGAVEVEDGVVLWGQVGVSKTLRIGSNAVVLAQSGVPSDLEGGETYFGTPAVDARSKRREIVWVRRIQELWDRVSRLESGQSAHR